MGSVRRAPRTGRWEARYRDPTGLQRTATFERKADALAFLAVTETDKRRGEWLEPEWSRVTLREWHARWWPTVEGSDRAPNTLVQYEGVVRVHVLPHLGDRRLATLRRIDVEEWLATLREGGLGQSGIRTARTLLGMMLSSAVESKVLRTNPLAGVKLVRRGPSRARQALTIPQVETLADEAGPYRVLVLMLAYCGLRPNEAFALRRRHRDDFGQLVIEAGLVEVRGRIVATDGKTHQARVVPLPRFVADELDAHLDSRPPGAEALVFVNSVGGPIGLRNFRRTLGAAAAAAGLPEWFTPYSLRHTCASLLAQQGVPVTTAAAILGHDPAMFLRVYSHLYPDDLRGAAAVLDAARESETRSACGADVVQMWCRGCKPRTVLDLQRPDQQFLCRAGEI